MDRQSQFVLITDRKEVMINNVLKVCFFYQLETKWHGMHVQCHSAFCKAYPYEGSTLASDLRTGLCSNYNICLRSLLWENEEDVKLVFILSLCTVISAMATDIINADTQIYWKEDIQWLSHKSFHFKSAR